MRSLSAVIVAPEIGGRDSFPGFAECPRVGIRAVPAQEVTVWRH